MSVITYRDSRGLLANVKPKVDEILRLYPGIPNVWTEGDTPDHNNLRCCDYMVFNEKGLGDAIAKYHIDNADRLGVQGIIWNRHVWRNGSAKGGQYTNSPQRQWDDYTGSSPHTDHVHVQYDDVAIKGAPTGGSGSIPTPKPQPPKQYPTPASNCDVYLDKLRPGVVNSDSVYRWRQAMNAISFVGGKELPMGGNYDQALIDETKKFQSQKCHDKPDGWPGPKQAIYGFQLARAEMQRNGVRTLTIYNDSKTGGLVRKVW